MEENDLKSRSKNDQLIMRQQLEHNSRKRLSTVFKYFDFFG